METKITFKDLRKIKDNLPDGSVKLLSKEFKLSEQTIRNYFGGANYIDGVPVGIHIEHGNGGVVLLDDDTILNRAKELMCA